jgi:hypothetical protein
MTFLEVARESLFRMLELVQLDRRGAAGAVVLEMKFVVDEAVRENRHGIADIARRGQAAAQEWADGGDLTKTRVEVVKVIASLFRELELEIR